MSGHPATAARELDTVAFATYLEGLHAAGWQGDVDAVRLAYAAWLSLFLGLVMPAGMHDTCGPEAREASRRSFGMADEELFWQYLSAMTYALDCADEARMLMLRLNV